MYLWYLRGKLAFYWYVKIGACVVQKKAVLFMFWFPFLLIKIPILKYIKKITNIAYALVIAGLQVKEFL